MNRQHETPLLAVASAIAAFAVSASLGAHTQVQNRPLLQITFPGDGTVVHLGQTIDVVVVIPHPASRIAHRP